MPADKLENLLNPSNTGDLGDIVKRARAMGELVEILGAALPDRDKTAIVAANIRDNGELVVICESSAWASRLRYETDTLLKAARDAGISAHTCRVRVTQR
jgi:hypothetical protein